MEKKKGQLLFDRSLEHENIVRFYGLSVNPPFFALVFELCERGSSNTKC
jgi:hypothetical protein